MSASADTDIVVVPALVLSGGTRRGAFAIKRQVSKARKNLRGKFGKISSIQK
jgi:hypothetical protein